jgi:uncharacterized phiE125 gp8 family phage protein
MAYPHYSTSLATAPAVEPLTLTEAKLHLRVDHTTDDDLITSLIVAARQYAENYTQRCFITQTWDLKLDAFPVGDILLVKPPVASVTSITYVDTDGTTQTLSSALYRTDLPTGPWAQRGRIEPAYGESWPSTRALSNAVTVRCVHGYGLAVSVPDPIKAALKLLIGHWYENREAVSVSIGANVQQVPMAVVALLVPFKAY